MLLKNVRIKNFKAIEDMDLHFQDGFNIILGNNGFGKTSILKAIAVALNVFFTGLKGVKTTGILQDDIRIKSNSENGSVLEWKYCLPALLDCSVVTDNLDLLEWSRIRDNEIGKTKNITKDSNIIKYLSNLLNKTDSALPIFSYQSDSRVWAAKKSKVSADKKIPKLDRRVGYIGCLEPFTDVKAIESWCLQMEVSAYQYKKAIPEYELFKKIVSTFMREMCELKELPTLIYDARKQNLVYSEDKTNFEDIHNLSSGYQSLLWMVIDIAYRFAHLNPNILQFQNITGIVLIDEIDMHLHPNWQWRIVNALTKTFPKIQFIATTHSPIIISSSKNANLIRLDSKQNIYYLPNSYASRISDILVLNQGSTDIHPKLLELDKEFEIALLQRNSNLACEIFHEMVDLFGKDNSVVRAAELDLDDCC